MEMWEYLSEVAPQYEGTLSVTPQTAIPFLYAKNQKMFFTDDGTPKISSRASQSFVYITLSWKNISEADANSIIDMWNDASKANGIARSFLYTNLAETGSKSYTVRFTGPLPGTVYPWGGLRHEITNIKLLVEGRAPAVTTTTTTTAA